METLAGYRQLKVGQVLKAGDKWFDSQQWKDVISTGEKISEHDIPFFRKLSPVSGRAKRDLQGSLQRRVGRSASGGKPVAVTRAVGRKKAVLPHLTLIRLKIGDRIQFGDWCCNERDSQQPVETSGGNVVITENHHPHYRIIAADAASCRRQRALPANEKISDSRRAGLPTATKSPDKLKP